MAIPRSLGLGMSAIIALLMAANAVRALGQPAAFAAYLGAPLADPADVGFVHVYAFRAAFLAILAAALLVRGDTATLRIVALAALVMPLGDAWLTHRLGASPVIVARHVGIALFLVATWAALGGRRKPSCAS